MKIGSANWSTLALAARPVAQESVARPVTEDPQAKRLQEMQEGLARLKELPRKSAQDKIGFLQRRLMELKQLLLHASPQQAKALMKELKSIAGELASVAKAAAASGGAQGGMNAGALMAGGSEQAVSEAGQQAPQAQAQPAAAAPGAPAEAGGQSDLSALKGVLTEARKLLKEVLAMMKGKLAHAPKDARDDLHQAEKKLGELDNALAQEDSAAALYSHIGEFLQAAEPDSPPSVSITV